MYVDAVTKKPFFELALRDSAADNARGNGVIREGGRFPFAYADATILDSFGKEVFKCGSRRMSKATVLFNDFRIPFDLPGGEYVIRVEAAFERFPVSFRKIRVGALSQPNLFVTVDFDKNAYVPGDAAQAKVKVRKPDGEKLPAGSTVSFFASEAN